ncbi:SLC13 family permease [Lysobacter korlensis]|uniref:SLC13 family permease n=1 Tax=Lysobacter korlensis TaxID=553636 RepID=A0ABV6RID0_9GAMM
MYAQFTALIAPYSAVLGLVLLAALLAGFILERFPPVVIATAGVAASLILGFIDIDDVLGAFANAAPVAIAALFILSGALVRTGAIEALVGVLIERAKKKPRAVVAELFGGTLFSAAFINNTPVVIILTPVMRRLARTVGVASTRLLIPLSYIAILGGLLTLVGTSTHLLVDGVAQELGQPAFGIFEITGVGLVAALGGILVLMVLGPWLLPSRPDRDAEQDQGHDVLSELAVRERCNAIGSTIGSIHALRPSRVKVLGVKREGETYRRGVEAMKLRAGDHLIIKASPHELAALASGEDYLVGIGGLRGGNALSTRKRPTDVSLFSTTIAPTHPSVGHRLAEIPMLSRLPIRILGLSRHRHLPGPDLPNARIRAADTLLIAARGPELESLRENAHLLGVSVAQAAPYRRSKAPIALAALVGTILLAATGVLSIAVAAILAVALLLLTRCIDPEEAWSSIDGNVLVLIYAMLAVGAGLQNAGSVDLVVDNVSPLLADVPPLVQLLIVYAMTSLLTEMVTNNAVAVIMAPVAIGLAEQLGIDPRPMLVAVMFAASASFATPVGYQTNTIVYAAADYRFVDFFKIGLPMNLIVGLCSCLGIYFLF